MTKKDRGGIWREALRATSLGWDLALPIFGGVLLGRGVDRLLSTTHVFTLSFLILGIAAGFYNVIRGIRRVSEHSRRFDARKTGKRDLKQ